jgi:hypothetical protein
VAGLLDESRNFIDTSLPFDAAAHTRLICGRTTGAASDGGAVVHGERNLRRTPRNRDHPTAGSVRSWLEIASIR